MFDPVKEAFTRQSEIFDKYEEGNDILKWMRSVTHAHVLRHLKRNDKILELNSGTGLDAVWFAGKGFRIHCTDISEGMLGKLHSKIYKFNLKDLVSYELLSYTELDKLTVKPFDYIFSNFGGLNCTGDLSSVFNKFSGVLNPGGRVTLVVIPQICIWELAHIIIGKFKTAFRRFHQNGVMANIEGIKFRTYYYSVSDVIKALGRDFKVIEIQGLASVSPPPYMINFPKLYPRLYRMLTRIDAKLSHVFPFNRCADHFILTAAYIPDN
jgi:ubiquinone/menaquinone biosynthesis C-methylase UbiE